MKSIATIPAPRLLEFNEPIRVYIKPREEQKPRPRQKPSYPKIIMPEQPTGYIRQRENDCL